jgi:formate hydrogenlyase subunit 3/multisubunit Na+/H+ antiporter MnhD subunit
MLSFLALIVVLLVAGAVGILGLSLVPRLRLYMRCVAPALLGLAVIAILLLRWTGPGDDVLSLWQPSLLFGAPLMLRNDVAMQPLAFVLALAACVAGMVTLGCEEAPSPWLEAVPLALLAAGFVALWAANPLTMIIGWAAYDLLLAVGCIATEGAERTAVRSLISGGVATLFLWGGTLLSGNGGGSVLWTLIEPSEAQLTLWMAAVVLRLWVYPFHLPAPREFETSPSLAMPLLSPVLGWGLCLRLALVSGGSLPGNAWVPALAALTLAMGGFLAWSCRSSRSALPWAGVGVTGATLLAAALARENAAAVISSGCVAWMLGVVVLLSTDGLHREAPWWSIPALIGAEAMLGLPFSLGFVSRAALLGGIAADPRLWWWVFFVGNALLVAALTRWLLAFPSSPLPSRYWRLAVYGVVLGLPALLLVVAGFYPGLLVAGVSLPSLGASFSLPGVVGWLLWALSLAGGGVLAWQDGNVRHRIEFLLSAAHDLLRLDWLYEAAVGAMNQGMGILRLIDEVVGGAGTLLWSLLLFLLILLIWSER